MINHLYQDASKSIHLCTGSRLIDSDPLTYLVWTLCDLDVPSNMSFKSSKEEADCKYCLDEQERTSRDNGQFGVGA